MSGNFDEPVHRRDRVGRFAEKSLAETDPDLGAEVPVLNERDAARMNRFDRKFASTLRDMNSRRLLITVDAKLPTGVVRCVDCGRFVGEASPAHSCPFPKFVEAGFAPALAQRLARAGFNRPYEAMTWRSTIEQLGEEKAGLFKALGVGPYDARRMDRAGIDPASLYPAQVAPSPSARAEKVSEMLNESFVALKLPVRDEDGKRVRLVIRDNDPAVAESEATWARQEGLEPVVVPTDEAMVEEVTAVGHLLAAEIDDPERLADAEVKADRARGRVAAQRDDAASEARELLAKYGRESMFEAFAATTESRTPATKIQDQYRDAYKEARPALNRYLLAKDELARLPDARALATMEVLSGTRPFGGDLRADVTRGSRPLVDAVSTRFPADWLAASADHATSLRIELGAGRAHYRHHHYKKSRGKGEREQNAYGTKSTRMWSRGEGTPTEDQMWETLRYRHPEAFDDEMYDKIGKSQRKSDMMTSRVRNISNPRWDEETSSIKFECDSEDAKIVYPPSEQTALIKTDRSQRAAIHEMGHRFENTVPSVQTLARTWRNQRTSYGQRDRVNTGVRGEWGFEGDFVDPYVGKQYRSQDTEVVSMGLEGVLSGSHGGLVGEGDYGADHDHRAFTLGLLATAGRPLPG